MRYAPAYERCQHMTLFLDNLWLLLHFGSSRIPLSWLWCVLISRSAWLLSNGTMKSTFRTDIKICEFTVWGIMDPPELFIHTGSCLIKMSKSGINHFSSWMVWLSWAISDAWASNDCCSELRVVVKVLTCVSNSSIISSFVNETTFFHKNFIIKF